MIVPKSRRTYDPEYTKAKTILKRYVFDATNLLTSIRQLSEHAQDISKFYLQFCSSVTGWYPNTTLAVQQSLKSIDKAADMFNQITHDSFINSINPNIEKSMISYRKQIDDLLILKRNRKKAVHLYDQNKEKLRKAQCTEQPDFAKINQLQRKVEVCESAYSSANNEFISAVDKFTESRKDDLIQLLKRCFFNITEYINKVTQISFIKFPDDVNAPPIVDPKSVVNHDDAVLHINQSQPILPPASSVNGQQLPIYVQNNYAQSTQVMAGYGNYQNQSQLNLNPIYPSTQSSGCCYYYNIPQNQQQNPSVPNYQYSFEVDPNFVERAVHSSSSEIESNYSSNSDDSGNEYDNKKTESDDNDNESGDKIHSKN